VAALVTATAAPGWSRLEATQLPDATNGDHRTVVSITGHSEETLRRWYDAAPNLQKKNAVIDMARL
jgi:hypothetical protein